MTISHEDKLRRLEGSRQYWLGRVAHSGNQLDIDALAISDAMIADFKLLPELLAFVRQHAEMDDARALELLAKAEGR